MPTATNIPLKDLEHLALLDNLSDTDQQLLIKATGRYYTHEFVARQAIATLLDYIDSTRQFLPAYHVADPFAGDGRMVAWLVREWQQRGFPTVHWHVALWDLNEQGLEQAGQRMLQLQNEGFQLDFSISKGDTFKLAQQKPESFDIVITNPPWEILKPDSRELKNMNEAHKKAYISALRRYDQWLTINYERSRPRKKFAGWGTNLSRVGAEATHLLCRKQGFVILVMPSSFFADEQSHTLRKYLLNSNHVLNISYFPAEARLYGKADTGSCTLTYQKDTGQQSPIGLVLYDRQLHPATPQQVSGEDLANNHYTISFHSSTATGSIQQKINGRYADWRSLEASGEIWAGREIDETRSQEWLDDIPTPEQPLFVKGKMIGRYQQPLPCNQGVAKPGYPLPPSARQHKIVWRDVSRQSQKRRMIATIVPPHRIAGNSLGVVLYKDGDSNALHTLLTILNSLVFEFQLRSFLSTGHISLSAVRKVRIPSKNELKDFPQLAQLAAANLMAYSADTEQLIEALVARDVYQLNETELASIIDTFEKIDAEEKEKILFYFRDGKAKA